MPPAGTEYASFGGEFKGGRHGHYRFTVGATRHDLSGTHSGGRDGSPLRSADGLSGDGTDEVLGRKLLVLFLEKLAASGTPVDMVGCVNAAVYLTTREGPALDSLKAIEKRGARIASCGTCLDHLGLRDRLKIGEVGNMEMTVKIMSTADRIIRP